jgi:hypothetical protein
MGHVMTDVPQVGTVSKRTDEFRCQDAIDELDISKLITPDEIKR